MLMTGKEAVDLVETRFLTDKKSSCEKAIKSRIARNPVHKHNQMPLSRKTVKESTLIPISEEKENLPNARLKTMRVQRSKVVLKRYA